MKRAGWMVWTAVAVWMCAAPVSAQSERLAIDGDDIGRYADKVRSSLKIPSLSVGVIGPDATHVLDVRGDGATDEPFLIGSLSKSVTAAAVMTLVEDDQLALDEPASSYVEGVPEEVTVEDLLRHQSGLDRADGFDAWSDTEATVEEAAARASWDVDRDEFSYSNLNYEILGAVVEEVSEQSYGKFVDERVFSPAGMDGASAAPEPPDERIVGHQYMFGFPVAFDEPAYNPASVPSGFVWMSAEDLAIWTRLFLNEGRVEGRRVLPAALIEALSATDGDYTMGWALGSESGSDALTHTGLTGAFSASATVVPDRDIGVFALANVNSWMGNTPKSTVESIVGSALRGESQSHSNLEFLVRLGFGLLCFFVLLLFLKEVLEWVTGSRPVALDGEAKKGVIVDMVVAAVVIAGSVVFFGVSPLGMLRAAPDLGVGFLLLVFALPLRRVFYGFNATEKRRLAEPE